MKTILVGRADECDVKLLSDRQVSRNHLQLIEADGGDVYVIDLGSTGGTFVFGNKIPPHEPFKLETEAIIRIGSTVIPWRKYLDPLYLKQLSAGNIVADEADIETIEPEVSLEPSAAQLGIESMSQTITHTAYAGFWLRFAAYIIDGAVLSLFAIVSSIVIGATVSNADDALTMYFVVNLSVVFLYFVIQEASAIRGTLGKKAVSIQVVDGEGNKIGYGASFVRNFGKIISAIILFFGFFMAGFTEHRQALHDMMASTYVVKTNRN